MGPAIAAACLMAGCFTDPINMKPEVRINPSTSFAPGGPASFTATTHDPDGDAVSLVEWHRDPSPCPSTLDDPANWPPTGWSTGDGKNHFTLMDVDTQSAFCVWAKVTDSHGAAAVDVLPSGPAAQPPTAMIELVNPSVSSSFPPHTQFFLSGVLSTDPDTEPSKLAFSWSLGAAPIEAGLIDCGASDMKCLVAPVPGEYQVKLRVTDDTGLFNDTSMTFEVVQGPPPVARLDLVTPSGSPPYALGSRFEITPKHSTFDSTLAIPQLDWQVVAPPGSAVKKLEPCNDANDPAAQCFVADVAGSYSVQLVITDANGTSTAAPAPYVVVADQPPCIDQAQPDFALGFTMATDFHATVWDDLDPGSAAHMQWFVSDGGPFVLFQNGLTFFSITPSQFPLGATVRVRLEVSDRDTARSAQNFLACGDKDTCAQPNALYPKACFQRATWTVHLPLTQ